MAGSATNETNGETIADGDVAPPSIEVNGLSYSFPDGSSGLENMSHPFITSVSNQAPNATRSTIMGIPLLPKTTRWGLSHMTNILRELANGAGKTTLLRLLSGKHMAPHTTVSISNQDPFTTGLIAVTYLGSEWVLNPIVRNDIAVPELLQSVGGAAYPERLRTLTRILDIDPSWRMHAVSDGERRRVQLAMGLLRPWKVLLLDEVTVDLDLLSRKGFLDFLKRETEEREATVVYATHILDHLAEWPTHLVHMCLGRVKEWGEMEKFEKSVEKMKSKSSGGSWMGNLVLEWIDEDLKERGPRKGQKEMWG